MNRQQTNDDAPAKRGGDGDGGQRLTRTAAAVAPAQSLESLPRRTEIAQAPDPSPAAPVTVPGLVAAPAGAAVPERGWVRARYTWQQILGAFILVAGCVVAAVWYVPRVLTTDRSLLSGTVVSSGVVTLNFTAAGQIDRLVVHTGQHVHKGQVLATEYVPNLSPVVSADAAAVASDKATLATLRSPELNKGIPIALVHSRVSAAQARLKLDAAREATDQARRSASQIVAPVAGTVTAANGYRGEAVTAAGIRDYATDSQRAATKQRPAFSLLPEGPQSVGHPASTYALPVVALSASSSWQIAALVPENSVSRVSAGERVTISVPAAQIARIPGRISEILSSPVATSQGTEYQALVTVAGHVSQTPLSGMAANVRLDAPARPRSG